VRSSQELGAFEPLLLWQHAFGIDFALEPFQERIPSRLCPTLPVVGIGPGL
jgi:hypothetical protein